MKKVILLSLGLLVLNSSMAQALITSEMDTVVVTASRLEQKQYEVAGNITVITEDEIRNSTAQTIPDVLRSALGVNVSDNSTTKSAKIDIRGFGETAASNVLVMIDGRRINSVDLAAPDLLQIPIGAVKRIEIIRGAGSVLYGDNAVGGVVNIITRDGEGGVHGRIGTTYGSYEATSSDVEVYGKARDLSYFIYAKNDNRKGFRDNSDLKSDDVNAKFQYDVNDNVSARLQVGYHDDRQQLPGGLSYADITANGRRSADTPNDVSFTKDAYYKFGLDVTPWTDELYLGDLVVDFMYRDRDVYDEFNLFSSFHTTRRIDTKGITAKYIFNQKVFDKDIDFVLGIDYYDHENDILGSGANVDQLTISKEELGIYGYLQYEVIDNLSANAGIRYHKADYTFNQTNVVTFQENSPDEIVSMGGLKYEYAKGSNVFANVQQSFRFLATDEWYTTANFPGFGITPGLNLGLKQQTGTQFEIGVKHNFKDKYVATLTPYWIELDNEIYFDPATFSNANYDETRRIGIEFGNKLDVLSFIDIDFLDRLEVVGNFTYQIPEFSKGSNDGKDIPFVPRHQAKLGIFADFMKYFNLSVEGRYVGSRFAVSDLTNNAAKVNSYLVLDSKITFNHKNMEIFGAINNITDEKYFSSLTRSSNLLTISGSPAPERNFIMGVGFK
ncbi:MAG: iron complex outermembrane receptor protein, partial [Lysobacterales bacterium]